MTKLDYNNSIAYFRGQYVPFKEANLNIASSPVLYGLSVYTVCDAMWDEETEQIHVFRLKDHYDRLVNSTKIMNFSGFGTDYPYEKFETMVKKLLNENNVQEDVMIRITVFVDELLAGAKTVGLKTSVSAFVYPFGEILARDGVHLCVSSWTRTSDNAIPPRAKVNGSYANAALMKNEALSNGYDDAIALDSNGHVAEGTVANLFLVRDGVLITPDSATDILEGITRDTVVKLAKSAGIPVQSRSIDRTELYIANEVFLSGSSALITPVLSIDRRVVGDGKRGSITEQISLLYKAAQFGKQSGFEDWTTKP